MQRIDVKPDYRWVTLLRLREQRRLREAGHSELGEQGRYGRILLHLDKEAIMR